jgi:hypothetical protein
MTDFWDMASCSIVEADRGIRGGTATIIRATLKRLSIPTKIRGAIYQKAAKFIISAVRTRNLTT